MGIQTMLPDSIFRLLSPPLAAKAYMGLSYPAPRSEGKAHMPELLKLSLTSNIAFQDSEPELMLPHWAAKGNEKKQVKDTPWSLRTRSLAEDSHLAERGRGRELGRAQASR
jgi:hypothetical protein